MIENKIRKYSLLTYITILIVILSCESKSTTYTITGTWIEIGRQCNDKGECKITPDNPQCFNFLNDFRVIVDNTSTMYYFHEKSKLLITEKNKIGNIDDEDSDSIVFLNRNTFLLGEGIYRYKFRRAKNTR